MPTPKYPVNLRRLLRRPRRKRQPRRPAIRFSPYAWAKLLHLRDLGPTEVGGFGIAESNDLLFVHDIVLVQQQCTETFVAFDDTAVADFFEDQVALGRRPEQVGRIWIHTHPGESPYPSQVDVETFERVFGACDWAVMFILARSGHTYVELNWRHGGPASVRLGVKVDYSQPFPGSSDSNWELEYEDAVQVRSWRSEPKQMDCHNAATMYEDWDREFESLMGYPADEFGDMPPITQSVPEEHQ